MDKIFYYLLGRGNGKSLTALVDYCRSIGMSDEEITELFREIFEKMED